MKVQIGTEIRDEDLKILWRSYLDRYGKRSRAFIEVLRDLKEASKEIDSLKSKLDLLFELGVKKENV